MLGSGGMTLTMHPLVSDINGCFTFKFYDLAIQNRLVVDERRK